MWIEALYFTEVEFMTVVIDTVGYILKLLCLFPQGGGCEQSGLCLEWSMDRGQDYKRTVTTSFRSTE